MSKFEQLKKKLAKRPGVTNPGGLAAAIGRKRYGAAIMKKAAAQGRSAQSVKDSDGDGY